MHKVIIVKTDDPDKSRFTIKVTGPVEKIVEIKPGSVHMEGNPGQTLTSTVTITPLAKYQFSLLNIKKRNNTPIQVDLVKPTGDNLFWQLSIKSTSNVEESQEEVLEIETDSKHKPLITIKVFAEFHDSKEMKL